MERQAKDGTVYQQVAENEWQPVTRKAKDGTTFIKTGVDTWKPLEAPKRETNAAKGAEAGLMAGLQGWTVNSLDEIAGGVEAAGNAVGLKGLGGSFSDIGLNDKERSMAEAYAEGRDRKRGVLKQQSEDYPMTTLGGQVVGAVVSPANKIAKGMSLAKGGAVLGGMNAFGASEAKDAVGLATDTATGAALGGALGKGFDAGAKYVPQIASKAANFISPAKQKANAQLIRDAADRLGIKVTPGMLDDSGFVERLESSLAKSPSFLGQSVKRNQDAVIEKMASTVDDVTQGATGASPFQNGEKFKSSLTGRVAERMDPLKAVFNDVAESTKSIPISQRSKDAVTRNIKETDFYSLTDGAGKAQQYVDMIGRLKNADQVKSMMTLIRSDIKGAQGAEKQVLMEIRDKLGRLEQNSITRGAVASAKEARMKPETGKEIGNEILTDLKEARKGWRSLNEDLTEVGEASRIKTKYGPSQFMDDVEAIPSEKIESKFLNLENNRQVNALRNKFPEEFELLKSGKLRDLKEASVDATNFGQGKTNAVRFLREVEKLQPEAKATLFGQNLGKVDDLQVVKNAMPRNFNPSGTASEQSWHNALYSNVKDIPTYALYRGASSNLARDLSSKLAKSPNALKLYEKNPAAFQKMLTQLEENSGLFAPASMSPAMASGNETEVASKSLKGEDKWAADGLKKLKEAGAIDGEDAALLSDPQVRRMLIEASDFPSGSPQVARIGERLRNRNARGGN